MKSEPTPNVLAVLLHGARIGTITRFPGERHVFAFDEEYVETMDRATLSLSFKGEAGGLVTSVRGVSRRVPPFFANVLPEGHLRTYLAEQAGVHPDREFFLLAALGADLPGAVTVAALTAGGEPASVTLEPSGEAVFRFSLAGVQLKFSAIVEAAGGLTIPAHGVDGSWIVKLPSTTYPAVSENEYAILELARAIGIEVPETRLTPAADIHGLPAAVANLPGQALAIRRFDRTPSGPVHLEDFAQVFGLFPEEKYKHRSYSNIASVLWAETGDASTYEFVRRLIFSVVIGNGDMHLKNWSLLYPDRRRAMLSPAYDFVSTVPYIPTDQLALTFGGSRSLQHITLDQIRRFADRARLPISPLLDIAAETIDRVASTWRGLEQRALLPPDMERAIDRQITSVRLLRS